MFATTKVTADAWKVLKVLLKVESYRAADPRT